MDVLEKYKSTWKNQPEEKTKYSSVEIYKMAHSRSSSIVKWIFIISILEFVLMNLSYFFVDTKDAVNEYKKIGLLTFYYFLEVLWFIVTFSFLILFYKNYKNVTIVDSTKKLMKKIITTRKTVKSYVLFNLSYVGFVMIVLVIFETKFNFKEIPDTKQLLLTALKMLAIMFLFLGTFWLFYKLLYGILLKKLNKNYKELAKLDDDF